MIMAHLHAHVDGSTHLEHLHVDGDKTQLYDDSILNTSTYKKGVQKL